MRAENFNVRHPLFRRLWVRVAICLCVAGWTLAEFIVGTPVFGLIAGLSGVYLFHQFFWVFDPKDYEPKDTDA